jgi:leucyl/phenylalanyl-tRNA--protein transferase
VPFYLLHESDAFPPAEYADPDGLLAVGGDLSPRRLLRAYSEGIFPWYGDGLPILWHSPDPRMVLRANELRIARSLEKTMRKSLYEIRFDTAFREVIEACASAPRPGQLGTWITLDMIEAYTRLHAMGYAHSAEAWHGGELVGGLYGVSLGGAFFGESMFAIAPDASKVAFVTLVRALESWDIPLIDCQTHTEHLARFGATLWPRKHFLAELGAETRKPTRKGRWSAPPPVTRP